MGGIAAHLEHDEGKDATGKRLLRQPQRLFEFSRRRVQEAAWHDAEIL